ncbi:MULTISPECIES: DJ-1/PfpI family protein [unclassified Paenibacillus]|uniref:DJ-1/PfpI family protein n=1 Tax=unclassified Paenibacillus TaxID=185978 RepID=UPI001AEA916D|nr:MULTISPECIES: DJ-1/PfpI family protein [unclassified Paenibacillus]MBP1153659.1 putative intracellular protease/amidase [Paenibacillus sp. PvP091]MBP1170956.1 putative intracellular protease/amidase [Paenibacillus sp. PvR098]MBP2441984.1 putative intracellular protease/amidase [Paenibacillus sp. PvP052]
MLTVQIVLFDGFDLLDAIAPYEVFCAAGMVADGTLHVEFVTAEGARLVPSGVGGLKIEASGRLSPRREGIILVPGASGEVEGNDPNSIPAILARAMNTELTGMLEQALGYPGIIVATVCGGSLVLAMGGMLEGRPAVTNHLGMDLLGATGAIPVLARVVDDGDLVTGGGVTSGLDVALHLVERELGPRIAHAVEQLFEYERRGTVWRNIGIPPRNGSAVTDPNTEFDPARPQGTTADDITQASVFDGEWDATIVTPVGKLTVKLHITTVNGVIQGMAKQGDEVSEFIDPDLKGNTLCWSQRIKMPMLLNLNFAVTVDGDHMTGIAKAGVLPASKLTGKRI